MSRKLSQVGIKLIKNFEGCRLTAYKPVATEQYYTIGWGHYGPDVNAGATITQAQADSMLIADLAKYEGYVNSMAYVPVTAQLNQNQFDALTSFTYNCGNGSLQQLCKGRTIAQIAENITKYNKGGGNVLAGLVRRRMAELDLYNKAVVTTTTATNTEEDDKLTLTTYQWTTLRAQVKALLDAKTITDTSWLTKIDAKTLTTSELAWLSFIVAKK
jgi:GH24 family phage-related lysozyme (muramidase)